jgi:hypothetical protein
MCYQGLILRKHNLEALAAGNAVCTKKCYEKANKELAGGEQEEGGRSGKWTCDGKGGLDDSHTSMRILIDWWMDEGNYR